MRVVPANIRHCGPGVPGLRSAISCQRVPSPSSLWAIDHSDSPVVTVCVRAPPRLRSSAALWVATAPWWLAAGGAQAGAAGVVLAGAVAATSWVAAADGAGRAGPAANSRTAAPTSPWAADWGSAKAGRCGVGIRRSRDSTSRVMVTVRNAQPAQATTARTRSVKVPSSREVRAVQTCSRVGTWSGIGLAPIASSMAGRPASTARMARVAVSPIRRARMVAVIARRLRRIG